MPKAKVSLLVIVTTLLITTVLLSVPYTPSVRVHTVQIEKGMFAESVRLPGVVGYADEQICFSPVEGRVERVYVSDGESVKKGDLLFRLDTSEAERSLAGLTAMQHQYEGMAQRLDALLHPLLQIQGYETEQTKQKLVAQIEAGQIRSEIDGKVDGIHLSEGQYISSMSAVGRIHGERKCVWVTAEMRERIPAGSAAVLSRNGVCLGTAVFEAYGAAAEISQASKRMKFFPVEDCLGMAEEGESVIVEVLKGECPQKALLPLAAVDSENEVWIVENRRAWPAKIDISQRNEHYVALSDEWSGKEVILLPDSYELTPGCAVKEHGA